MESLTPASYFYWIFLLTWRCGVSESIDFHLAEDKVKWERIKNPDYTQTIELVDKGKERMCHYSGG